MNGTVYILMLDRPLGNGRHQAQFSVGWAKDLGRRLWHQQRGSGAAFTRAAVERGIGFRVIWQQPDTKADERRIKDLKNTRRFLHRQGITV
jgi:putative endonuclease